MNKKSLVMIAVVFCIIVVAMFFFIRTAPTAEDTNPPVDDDTNGTSEQIDTREEALEQARSFEPTGNCTQAITPAVHEVTGAQYEFPSGCIPEGWIKDRSGI